MSDESLMIAYDLSPALKEGKIRDRLIELGWTPPPPESLTVTSFSTAFKEWYSDRYNNNTFGLDGSISAFNYIYITARGLDQKGAAP